MGEDTGSRSCIETRVAHIQSIFPVSHGLDRACRRVARHVRSTSSYVEPHPDVLVDSTVVEPSKPAASVPHAPAGIGGGGGGGLGGGGESGLGGGLGDSDPVTYPNMEKSRICTFLVPRG